MNRKKQDKLLQVVQAAEYYMDKVEALTAAGTFIGHDLDLHEKRLNKFCVETRDSGIFDNPPKVSTGKKVKIKFDFKELDEAVPSLREVIRAYKACVGATSSNVKNMGVVDRLITKLSNKKVGWQLKHPKPKPKPKQVDWANVRMQKEALEFHMDDILDDSPYKDDLKDLKDSLELLIKTRGNL